MDRSVFLLLPPAASCARAGPPPPAATGLTDTTGDGATEPLCRRKLWRCRGCVAQAGLPVVWLRHMPGCVAQAGAWLPAVVVYFG